MRTRVVAALVTILSGLIISVPANAAGSQIVISIVTFNDSDKKGSIELFNRSTSDVGIEGWVLEYAKQEAFMQNDVFNCSAAHWSGEVSADSELTQEIILKGIVRAGESVTLAFDQPVARSGSLRLVSAFDQNAVAVAHDIVGWSDSADEAVCSEEAPASVDGGDITRVTDEDDRPVDTNNNLYDFSDVPLSAPYVPCPVDLTINELYPSPVASLDEQEYVELYNPTVETMNLDNCWLRRGDKAEINEKSSWYRIGGVLRAGEYLPVQVSFTLLNNGGLKSSSAVELFDDTEPGKVIDKSHPYGSVANGKSWSLVGEVWMLTEPTRGVENPMPRVIEAETEPDNAAEVVAAELPACAAGKYRNPDTNRCRNIDIAVSGLVPCDEYEERNPETNRCRKVMGVAGAALAACQPGYERNPATNRCRKVASAESSLKPCGPGQMRNPETNRCKKVVAAPVAGTTLMPPGEDAMGSPAGLPGKSSWWLTGFLAAGVAVYGGYEWRHELLVAARSWHRKLLRSQ